MKLRIFIALAVLCGLLGGCGGGGGNGGGSNAQLRTALVGTWRVVQAKVTGGALSSCPTTVQGNGISYTCGPNDTVTFNSDGTFATAPSVAKPQQGTWQLNDNTLTIVVTSTTPVDTIMFDTAMANGMLALTGVSETSAPHDLAGTGLILQRP